jgi:glycosyltransferase involved in cell wall biosynthesis
MRVVLLVTDLERGGTPLRLARLARGLKRLGVEVHVGCLASAGPVGAELESDAVPTFACNARGPRDLFALRRLASHLLRIQPDLVHATLTHANVAARLVGDWLRIPVVTSTATIEVERRWHLTVERCTAALDRGHIVNSRALADHVATNFAVPRERIYVVPPSIDPVPARIDRSRAREQFGLPTDAFVVLWAGRFDPVKRLDIAIRCAELLARQGCHLLLAGDGPTREQIEMLVRASPASPSIHLLGWQRDLAPALSAADAFLFPSLTEGMPNAVLQAMAFGLPVVGSHIAALRELAGDEERILLVAEGDEHGFAAGLLRLYEEPELRRELGHRAADWARLRFDLRRTVQATRDVYEHVLSRRG